ncbi:transmembrane amino acid transporter protein-domain-containing protein [Macrophomina phaseolina]|uniref:Transmembrane amino acid transporter protein-domain-containing protein n=1 Tax=Macrophomina phaseolina TaxID=35725 RepID=A0ABQ8GRU8_9PEZI|nr:transmembrane amino acid transporter protein-domain-containing protein [Macrophomina phaseolina]
MATYAAISAGPSEHEDRPASAASHRGRRSRHGKRDVGFVGQATWASSVINLVNTILGAGLLAMPHALSQMGILLGCCVIVWAGLTAGFGLYLQTRCAKYLDRGTASFASLSKITYPNAAVVFDAAIAIKCFGVGVSYLIIIGDLMPGVVRGFSDSAGEIGFLVDRQFWVTAFMLIVIPLSFLRRLDSLKYTSMIALVSISYLVILVLAHFFKGDTMADRGEVHVINWSGPIAALSVFPVVVFAYTCHQNMFSILNEIFDNSHFRTTSVVGASIGLACFLYILVGITGYLSYGDKVGGNIVSMYAPSAASTIGRLAIVILVMFSYPLQVHPCRASVDAVISWRPHRAPKSSRSSTAETSPTREHSAPLLGPPKPNNGPIAPLQPKAEPMSELRFAIITTIIIVLSYITAMTVSSLEKVLAYVGSTGSTAISFILPGIFYYKISSPDSPHHQRLLKDEDDEDGYNSGDEENMTESGLLLRTLATKTRDFRRGLLRKLSLALSIYGVFVMVVCLGTNTFLIAAH